MVDIRKEAGRLFGEEISCREIPGSFDCELKKAGRLPSRAEIDAFCGLIPVRDRMKIIFSDGIDRAELPSDEGVKSYEEFASAVSDEDETNVRITITKNADGEKSNVISVYCLEKFLAFFTGEKVSTAGRLGRWNDIVKKAEGNTAFEVLNTAAECRAGAFIFTNDASCFDPKKDEREVRRRRANEACTFMDRREIKLLPGDFTMDTKAPEEGPWLFGDLAASMGKLETVMALIFLGQSSRIEEDEVVLTLAQGARELHFPMDGIPENKTLTGLMRWILAEDNAVERAEIARNTAGSMYGNEAELLTADNSLRNAVESSHSLYRRKAVDRYIDIKKQLNKGIIDSSKQVGDMIGSLADSFKTNFIAAVTAVITQVLAKNIDFAKKGTAEFISPQLDIIIEIYCIASLAYLGVTFFHIYYKWSTYCRQFDQMKDNFKSLLSEEELKDDIENAGKIKQAAEKRLLRFCLIIGGIWIVFLILVWIEGHTL